MSREAVVWFLARVRADATIRTRLGSAPTGEAYVEQGARAGCVFSLAELRSVTNAEQFYGRVQKDPALSRCLSTARDEAAVVALAKAEGLECKVEDLQAVLLAGMGPELSDAQLERVAGGRGSGWSFPDVGKAPGPGGLIPIPYPNFG